jgi:hypothetical protein
MEPGNIVGRNLQVEDPRRAVLKYLTVVGLFVHGHDGRLDIGAADPAFVGLSQNRNRCEQ